MYLRLYPTERKTSPVKTKMHAYVDPESWNGFISSQTIYVDEDMIDCAILDHAKKVVDGDDRRTLVHTNINLHHWLCASKLSEQYGYIHFNAIFNGTVIDEKTPADLYIVKAQDPPHQFSLYRIISDLINYASSTNCLNVGGGNLVLGGEVRRPDAFICPIVGDQYPSPRFLLEVEVAHRSGPAADKWCREYFDLMPKLQAVLLIKAYARRANTGHFGALAVLYRRENPGSKNVIVDDAVSFGTEILSDKALSALCNSAPAILDRLRYLPAVDVPAGEFISRQPWKPSNRPYVSINAQDLLHWKIGENGASLLLPGLEASSIRDCRVELWNVLAQLNMFPRL